MKVMIFNVSGKGGIAHYNYFLCRALHKQGVSLLCVTSREKERYFAHHAFPVRPILFPHYHYQSPWFKGIFYVFSLGIFFIQVLKEKPDLVHWHELKIYSLEYMLLKYLKRCNIKCVLSAHDVLHPEKQVITPYLKKLYHTFDAIIAHTEDSRNILQEVFRVVPEKIQVIPHGEYSGIAQQMGKEEARSQLGISLHARVILFFGYIRPYKGLDILLQAFSQVQKKIPEAVLLIAGEAKESFKKYEQFIKHMGISNGVKPFIGYVPLEKVPMFFSSTDIVVLPYRHIYQSGVVHLAFGFQRPVIVTRVGGLPETVEHGKTGFVVPPEDPQALAMAIIEAFSNPRHLEEMGKTAYQKSQEGLSWACIAERTIAVYRSLYKGNCK